MICEQWIEKDKKGGGRGLIDVIFLNLFVANEENKENVFGVTDVQAEM